VVAVVVVLAIIYAFRNGGDFEVYWRSARRFLRGEPLYPASDGLGTYRYSPGILVLLLPLAALPLKVGLAGWYLLLVVTTGWLARVLPGQIRGPVAGLAVLVGFLGVLRPFLDEYMYAQANLLVLGLAVAAFIAEDRGREFGSGFLVALAVGLKLTPAILVLDMLLRRRWRALAGAAVGGVALLVAPVVTYGPRGAVAVNLEWFESLRSSATGIVGSQMNQGVFGQVALATQTALDGPIPPGAPTWVAIALAAAVVAIALLTPGPYPRRGMMLFAMAAAGPLGWLWNFVCAWPLMAWIASTGRRQRWAVGLFGVALLIPMYDVSGQAFEEQVFGAGLPGIGLMCFFLFAWTLQRRRARAAGTGPPAAA
jgi:alpha-1,2-mannosyltransferase